MHVKEDNSSESQIKVSAIVSTCNSERFMRGCLQDLVDQTLYEKAKLEIIVVDSGSQQNERAIVEEFRQRFHSMRYVRTEERETVYAAWNKGIKAASGEYITNANTDDRHRKDALEIMATTLDGNLGIGLVYADVIVTGTENEIFEKHTPVDYYQWLDYDRKKLTLGCFMGPQPMWRKSLHDKYGYFDETFLSSGDWEFWLRLAEGTDFLHIREFLGLYFLSCESLEHKNRPQKMKEDRIIYRTYVPKYFPEFEEYFNKIITTRPALVHIYRYGQILAAFEKYDRAISLYELFLQTNPSHEELKFLLSDMKNLKAQYLSARSTDTGNFQEMHPAGSTHSSVPGEVMAFIHQADVYIANNDFAAAREAIKRALRHAAGDCNLISFLNNILVQFRDPESARRFLNSKRNR